MKEVNKAWQILVEEFGVNEDTLLLIANINGYSMKTLNDVIYSIFGYRSLEQLLEAEGGFDNE